MTQPGVQSQETAQGYTPEELETLLAGVDAAIAAGLIAVAAFIVAQMVLPGAPKTGPGAPFISMDALNLTSSIWGEELDERIMPLLAEMFDESAERVAEDLEALGIPSPAPIADVTAADILAQARNRLVAIGDDLWNNMRTSLAEGMRLGETIPELSARVREAAPVTVPRSQVIARTEAIGAANQASITQARSAGVALEKGWEATDDTRTRLAHREADGQWVPLDGMFDVGGELLDIPGDPRGSASNVINCRCTVLFRIAVTTAGFRPQFHTCRGEDGLPTHKGPCRGSTRSPRKTATPKAKTEKVPKPKAVAKTAKAAKVPARARPFHQSIDGLEDLAAVAAASRAGNDVGSARLYGGQSSDTQLVRLADGRSAIHKLPFSWNHPEDSRQQSDSEQLASLIGRVVGAPVPRVFRDDKESVWMEFIADAKTPEDAAPFAGTPESVRLGLLDALIMNVDRAEPNLLVRDGRLIGIDHGAAWALSHDDERDPATSNIPALPGYPIHNFAAYDPVRRESLWKQNPLTPADIDRLNGQLESLRPEFVKVGRGKWLDYSLNILEQLRPYARGTVDLYG